MLSEKWMTVLEQVDYAFQPIVNSYTGKTYALEALIRKTDMAGFQSIDDFFDTAYRDKVLFELDVALREKALNKFLSAKLPNGVFMFYNYDPRVLEMPNHHFGATEELLRKNSIENRIICYELNEKNKFTDFNTFKELIEQFKRRGVKVAIDDFGAGFASFELFYHAEPDIIKLDRFLIQGIHTDYKKRTFCTHIVNLAKMLGVMTVAEGVETDDEYDECRRIGFDLIQGYFIQKPTTDISLIRQFYHEVVKENGSVRPIGDAELITKEIQLIEAIKVQDGMQFLIEKFHHNPQLDFFPVIDNLGVPLGIVHNRNIKKFIYSPFGKDLLKNKSVVDSLEKFITKCPIVDLDTPQGKILEIYLNNPDCDGVIITRDHEYFGFLTAKSLLNVITEKRLSLAREMNPLTRLPGNNQINTFIGDAYLNPKNNIYLIHYDLNDFKPFNDKFGFKIGDEAIKRFAETLKGTFQKDEEFIGHIGGDDFFVGLAHSEKILDEVVHRTRLIITQFSKDVLEFYDQKDNERGYYFSRDRKERLEKFPLLSASAAIMEIPQNLRWLSSDEIFSKLSELKKQAKQKRKIIVYTCTDCRNENV